MNTEFKTLVEKWNDMFSDHPIKTSIVADTETIIEFYLKAYTTYLKLAEPEYIQQPIPEDMKLVTCLQFLKKITKDNFPVNYGVIIMKSPRQKIMISYTINYIIHAVTFMPTAQGIVQDIKNEIPILVEKEKQLKSQLNDTNVETEKLKDEIVTELEVYKELIEEKKELTEDLENKQSNISTKKQLLIDLLNQVTDLKESQQFIMKKMRIATLLKEIENLEMENSEIQERNASLNLRLAEKHKCLQHYENLMKRLEGVEDMLENFSKAYLEGKRNYTEVEKMYEKRLREINKETASMQAKIKSMYVNRENINNENESIASLEKYLKKLQVKKAEFLARDEKLLQAKRMLEIQIVTEMKECREIEGNIDLIEEKVKSMIKQNKALFDDRMLKISAKYDGFC